MWHNNAVISSSVSKLKILINYRMSLPQKLNLKRSISVSATLIALENLDVRCIKTEHQQNFTSNSFSSIHTKVTGRGFE